MNKPKLITLAVCAPLLVGCHRQAEQEPARFTEQHLARFEMVKEITPPGYPDIYLVKDTTTTNRWVLFYYNPGNSQSGALWGSKL